MELAHHNAQKHLTSMRQRDIRWGFKAYTDNASLSHNMGPLLCIDIKLNRRKVPCEYADTPL
jgi:hypothetical protein